MSRENVELVRRLQPPPDMDLVALFRDDEGASRLLSTLGPYVHEDFVAAGSRLHETEVVGLAGLRAGWADWLEPWDSYRVEIEDVIDAGDEAVVVVTRDYGRRAGMNAEVSILGAAVWIVREGKVVRATFYTDRDEAFEAAGLSR
ncbi:MAG TPA: nuclear transport factor 2 family protein [Solirubrobacterales bacterium]|jgi:ketosteroid isomerase-like protein